ncbi:hypothetical protein [Mycobacterium sp. URHB0021]
MTSFVAGASQGNVEHHPEILAVIYAEWFTYIFAIWEEQFRSRLADFWDAQLDDKIRRSDILVDYFGDIRLINDFVHTKRICKESADAALLKWNFVQGQPIEISPQQMISLIDRFPRDELWTAPAPQPPGKSESAPGRINAHLFEDVKERPRELELKDNELAGAAFSSWLEANRG